MNKSITNVFKTVFFLLLGTLVFAQSSDLQYFRSWDKRGINVFEPSKSDDQPEFDGFKIKIGAGFTQDYQSLKHSNVPFYVPESANNPVNRNLLYGASSEDSTSATLTGFNTAMANLYLDAQLADGIRLSVESYMSSRHHNDFWVKGGYIQIDKLPMFNNPDWFQKYFRIKIGHFQPNYGDMQHRRTDAGNAMYNPFVENYILDAFTTEIGGEVYYFPLKGLMLMGGITGGTVRGNIDNPDAKPAPFTFDKTPQKASIFGKLAYDRSLDNFRFRVSGSFYKNDGSADQTLYFGDRAGSHYHMVMEPNRTDIYVEGINTGPGQSTYAHNKDSGKFIPLFRSQVTSTMINAFLQYKGIKGLGLESFITYEQSKGRSWFEQPADVEREISQFAGELVARFGNSEQLFAGIRYNAFTGRPPFAQADAKINRTTFVVGWFPLNCMLIKAEYVTQEYKDFSPFDVRHEGKFDGFVLQATVGF